MQTYHYLNLNLLYVYLILQSSELWGQLHAVFCEALMINDMGKAARQWPERIKLTLNSVVLLAFCFCTLHTMTLLRVPVFWLSFTNIRFYIFYTCLSRNHSQMLCKMYFITSIVFFFLGVPMLALFNFLIISSNFICKSSINMELPLCSYYIVSKMRTHSMYLGH